MWVDLQVFPEAMAKLRISKFCLMLAVLQFISI